MRNNILLVLLLIICLCSCDPAKFTKQEKEIIMSGDTSGVFVLKKVSRPEDSTVLYHQSIDVTNDLNDEHLNILIKRMYKTVTDPNNPGVGLAAPQIGINRRVIWVQRFDFDKQPLKVYLNPRILKYFETKTDYYEGCLSVDGLRAKVWRPDTIVVEYTVPGEKPKKDTVFGFTSRIFQHEIDHLDGVLYMDRIDNKNDILTEEEYKTL